MERLWYSISLNVYLFLMVIAGIEIIAIYLSIYLRINQEGNLKALWSFIRLRAIDIGF